MLAPSANGTSSPSTNLSPACLAAVLNSLIACAIDPWSVFAIKLTKVLLVNKNLTKAKLVKTGNVANGLKTMLAAIPAAISPPAPPLLPDSPIVNTSTSFWKFLRPLAISLPNMASSVSSP